MPGISLDARLRLLLTSILCAAYLIVYLGQPTTIDGKATLAVTSSVVKHGTPDITVLGSAEGLLPPISRMGSFGTDGLLYAKKGVTPSLLLLPLVALAHLVPALPVRATAMLFNPLVTTLTALLLYTFARHLDTRPRTAFITALFYGIGTMALIYTQTLFGEPLAALFLLGAVLSAFRYRQQPQTHSLVAAGVLLGLLIGINLTYSLMVPIVGLYAFGLHPRHWRIRHLAIMIFAFASIILLLLVYNLARFGHPLQSGYQFAEGEGFTFPLFIGLFGLTFSPYGGIFIYNPILWLAIPGALLLRRQNTPLLATIIIIAAAQVFTYASWWSWHGGIVWGPRFAIPIIPLLALLLLPVIDQIDRHRIFTVVFAGFAAISIGVQWIGALYDFVPYTMSLYDQHAAGIEDGFFTGLSNDVIFRFDLSPILGQITLIQSGQPPQPALFQTGDTIHLLLVVMLVIGGIAALFITSRWIVPGLLTVIVVAVLGVASRQQHLAQPANTLAQALLPADMIVAASTSYEANLIDLKSPARIITTNAPTTPDDPLASSLWQVTTDSGGLMWFITWFPPASPENWQERDLWQNASFVRETTIDNHRALLFDLSPPAEAIQQGNWQFGPVTLSSYGIKQGDDGIHVTLAWQRNTPIHEDYSWFVHLLDASGQIVQQQDRAPQGGYAPASTWQDNTTISDHLFFPLEPGTDRSGWQLRIGYVDSASGERLTVTSPTDQPIDEDFITLPVG